MVDQSQDFPNTLIVDIDGTLCPIKPSGESYENLAPHEAMVERLRNYQKKGYTILLYTSRNMRTHRNNVGRINKHTAPILLSWLEKWSIPYDEILFGKPWPGKKGFYIDDRTVRPNEFLNMTEEEIQKLLGQSD